VESETLEGRAIIGVVFNEAHLQLLYGGEDVLEQTQANA